MLSIVRKPGESIVIDVDGEKIIIRIKDASRGRARIAIDAPRRFKILRDELADKGRSCPCCGDELDAFEQSAEYGRPTCFICWEVDG
jgi:carbon storage regulator CsrA